MKQFLAVVTPVQSPERPILFSSITQWLYDNSSYLLVLPHDPSRMAIKADLVDSCLGTSPRCRDPEVAILARRTAGNPLKLLGAFQVVLLQA